MSLDALTVSAMRRSSQDFIVPANGRTSRKRRAEQGNLRAGPMPLGPRNARADSAFGAVRRCVVSEFTHAL
jgi:hypothetical protein